MAEGAVGDGCRRDHEVDGAAHAGAGWRTAAAVTANGTVVRKGAAVHGGDGRKPGRNGSAIAFTAGEADGPVVAEGAAGDAQRAGCKDATAATEAAHHTGEAAGLIAGELTGVQADRCPAGDVEAPTTN